MGLFGDLERRFIDVLDRVSDAIVALDRTGALVYVEPGGREALWRAPAIRCWAKICWDLFRPRQRSPPSGSGTGRPSSGMTPVASSSERSRRSRTSATWSARDSTPSRLLVGVDDATGLRDSISDERRTAERAERAMSSSPTRGGALAVARARRDRPQADLAGCPALADVCIVDLLAGESLTRAAVKQRAGVAAWPAGTLRERRDGAGHSIGTSELSSAVTDDADGLRDARRSFGAAGSAAGAGKADGRALALDPDDSRRLRRRRPSDDRSAGRSGGPGAGERASLRAGRQRQARARRDDQAWSRTICATR